MAQAMKHYFTTTEQFKMLMRELGVEVEHAKVGRQVRNQKGTGNQERLSYLLGSGTSGATKAGP